jgi:hypothetical protein
MCFFCIVNDVNLYDWLGLSTFWGKVRPDEIVHLSVKYYKLAVNW